MTEYWIMLEAWINFCLFVAIGWIVVFLVANRLS